METKKTGLLTGNNPVVDDLLAKIGNAEGKDMKDRILYHVQDSDRPMYVVATSWMDALAAWKKQMAAENEESVDDIEEPDGIMKVADPEDLIEQEGQL